MRTAFLSFFCCICFFVISNTSIAQKKETNGKEFWVGFMDTYDMATIRTGGINDTLKLNLYISSEVNTNGMISIPGTSFTRNFSVVPNAVTIVNIHYLIGKSRYSESIETRGIKVTSKDSIRVFASSIIPQSTDASLVLPIQSLGNFYLINSYKGIDGPSEFLIVAANDDTFIEIIPSQLTKWGKQPRKPFSITLNAGEVYQVQSDADLSGSFIKGNDKCKPFAVFAGAFCANVPYNISACNHLYEQMFPIKNWGQKYYTVPLKSRKADLFRIMAVDSNTRIYFDGNFISSLHPGNFKDTILSRPTVINSDKKIAVAQYSLGSNYDNTDGDPFLLLLMPVEQTLDNFIVNTVTGGNNISHYMNITTKTVDKNLVQLDGVNIGTLFSPFPFDPAYSYAQVDLGAGFIPVTHTVKGKGISCSLYGYGAYDSYGFTAGGQFKDLTINSIMSIDKICVGNTITFQSKTEPYKEYDEYKWDFGDGTTSSQKKVTHCFKASGTFTVKLFLTNNCSGEIVTDTVIKQITVLKNTISANAGRDTTICAGQSIQLNASGGTNYFWEPSIGLDNPAKANPIASPVISTTYKVRVGDASCEALDELIVYVNNLPKALYAFTKDSLTVNFKGDNNNGVYRWLWDFGDRSVNSSEQNPKHTYLQKETFIVTLIVWNQCGSDTIYFSVNVDGNSGGGSNTGYDDSHTMVQDIKVYPNPFNDQLNIDFWIQSSSKVSLDIYDILGRKIYTYKIPNILNQGKQTIELNKELFTKEGTIFYLQLQTESATYLKKVLKW